MAGIRQTAFQTLLDGRSRVRRAGLDGLAQRHPRLQSTFRSAYRLMYCLLRPAGMMTANIGGVRVSADTSQRDLMLLLRREADWELRQTQLIESLLDERMVFVDVGAHIGLYTLLAASQVGPRGKVFAFEPAPENFRVLKYNIAQNGFANVVAEQKAVSRGRGRAVFTLSEEDSASHTLASSLHEGRRIETETISLDEYFEGRETPIGVIKVDAEGAELGILEGMEGILSRQPELTLFTEIYPRAMEAFGSSPEEYLRQLDEKGFAIVPVDEEHHGEMQLEPDGFAGFLENLRARGEGTNLLCRRRKAAKIFAVGAQKEERSREGAEEREARQPLISIAIPTYNRGALLEVALASILPQIGGRKDVEVVVYDTGSVDDTSVRMARLAREHEALRFCSLPRRQSLDETLLLLLEECRGEYIWFFSSDDQMKPGAVEAVRRRIMEARERPALVYVNQEIVDESGKTLVASQVGKPRDRDFRDGRKILPWLGLNLGFISASAIRRRSALRATSAPEFLGTRSLNLHLYLRCLLEGGAALYVGKPLIRARRASGAPPYEYADVFVRDIVRILEDAGHRGFSWPAIYRTMHRITAGQYLRLVISWRAEDPTELVRTFPAMARACWKYPAFWLLLVPARLAPAGMVRRVRNGLRGWRGRRNQRHDQAQAEQARIVKSAAMPAASNFRGLFGALISARKLILRSGTSRIFKAIPFLVTAYRKSYAYLRPKQIIETVFGGHKLYLDLTDLGVAHSLVTSGAWEKYETNIFTGVLKKGMVVVDIGANIGHYTLEAARAVGETGKVFAFEPEPHNFSLLERNVEANHYRNVVLERCALSNQNGEARLALSASNLGGHHLARSGEEGETVVVSMVTLDEYLREDPRGIDVIKMDAEGAEVGILEGMKATLAANPDVILFVEFSPRAILDAGHNPGKFLETLAECGFQLGILDQSHARMEAFPDVTPDEFAESLLRAERGRFYVDLLCVRGKAAEGPYGPKSWWRERVFAQAAGAK